MKRGLTLLTLTLAGTLAAYGAGFHEAKVTQIIHDVKVLGGRTAARAASVNDAVGQGDAVRTGQESRAELTFSDLTITRLGANTVFSFDESRHEVHLDSGALLLSVPRDGAAARINSAAATAAISGGTALYESNPGFPTKFMVLEGLGNFSSKKDPTDSVEVAAGEMVLMTPDGKINKTKFNVGLVYHTAKLLTDFPELPNADLIQQIIDLQGENPPGPIDKDPLNSDAVDQNNAGSPAGAPSSPGSSKFGPLPTITSPNPYVINSSTAIQTDPTITTNAQTDLGKIYRDEAQDGPVAQYLYGSASAFDAQVFDTGSGNEGAYAVFKFAGLQLAGDPTISTTNGGAINLALVSVGDITSAAPGGVLTFAGIDRLFIGTQNGSINLGTEIEFNGPLRLTIYARGASSDLLMGSVATADNHIHLFAERDINIENVLTTSSFKSIAGRDFFIGKGSITAFDIDITAGHDITFHTESIPDVDSEGGGGAINLDAGNTLTLFDFGDGTFSHDSLTAHGETINLHTAGGEEATFDFSNSSFVTFTAGEGGINASTVDFFGGNLTLESAGNIDIGSANVPDDGKFLILSGSISAAGAITSAGDIETGSLSSGGDITASGHIIANDIFASSEVGGATTPGKVFPASISAQEIIAVGGSIYADGDITATNGTIELDQDSEGTFGNIHAGGDISASGGIFTPGDPCVVFAGGSISAPVVITGTLHGTSGITIDNTTAGFEFGIIANNVITAGTLAMINSPEITPNNRTSSGGVGGTPVDFLLQAAAITSSGSIFPVLRANGSDASDDPELGNPGNGGKVTIKITTVGLDIGDAQDLDSIQANGGDFNFDPSAPPSPDGGGIDVAPFGGDGGTIDITASGNVTIIAPNGGGPAISATTGVVSDVLSQAGGDGGTVKIATTGSITVGGTVLVSSDDASDFTKAIEGDFSGRQSASGGTIYLQSNLTTGAGITVGPNGELLSLLGAESPGPAGSITLSTMGADIVINGRVQCDFGTITLDQNDPLVGVPVITVDGGTLQAANLNITGLGDLNFGETSATHVNIFVGTWTAAHDINFNAANTAFAFGMSLSASATNAINFTGGSSDTPVTLNLSLTDDATLFHAGAGGINGEFVDVNYSGGGPTFTSGGDVTLHSFTFTDSIARGSMNATGNITITGDLGTGSVMAGGDVEVGGSIFASTISADNISAGGNLQASSATVTDGGNITVGFLRVQHTSAPNGIVTANFDIRPDVFSTSPEFLEQGAKAPHTITAGTVVSPNGIDFSGNQFGGINGYSSGGILTIDATTLDFNTDTGIGNVNFNGADAGTTDFGGMVFTAVGGDGGSFTANTTTGDLTVASNISATTGNNLSDPNNPTTAEYRGAGGKVALASTSGAVSVNSTIQVSSNEPVPFSTIAPQPYRKSASGGNITLTSAKSSGVAISVGSSGQLLALLDNAAPGPGGKITIVASGSGSSVDINNQVQADRGTVDIRQTGNNGSINLADNGKDSVNIRGDIVKIGALGTNGTLNIGSGTISADTLLKLYAGGSNGTINFNSSVMLNGNSTKIIAANTVNIFGAATVVTIGGSNPADVYTQHANYTGSGGNGTQAGTFGGAGANAPQPLASAPPFDTGSRPPRTH